MLQLREYLADKRENHQNQVYQRRASVAAEAKGFTCDEKLD
jgi:hypothetical protein